MNETLLSSQYAHAVYLARRYQRVAEILLVRIEALANEDAERDTAIQESDPSFSIAEVPKTANPIEPKRPAFSDSAVFEPIDPIFAAFPPHGIYSRIARKTGKSKSFCRRVALGMKTSKQVKDAFLNDFKLVRKTREMLDAVGITSELEASK
jgi:hypothetical protein